MTGAVKQRKTVEQIAAERAEEARIRQRIATLTGRVPPKVLCGDQVAAGAWKAAAARALRTIERSKASLRLLRECATALESFEGGGLMRTLVKRVVMLAYCHGLIGMATTERLFRRLRLADA